MYDGVCDACAALGLFMFITYHIFFDMLQLSRPPLWTLACTASMFKSFSSASSTAFAFLALN